MAGQFEDFGHEDSERAQSRIEALGITIPSVLGRSALGEDTRITGEAMVDCQAMHDVLGNVPRTYQDGAVYDLNTGRRII